MKTDIALKRFFTILVFVSLVFSLAAGTVLLLNLLQSGSDPALDNSLVEYERAQLESGADPAAFRQLHLLARRAIFQKIDMMRNFRFLLIVSCAVFLFSWHTLTQLYGKTRRIDGGKSFAGLPGDDEKPSKAASENIPFFAAARRTLAAAFVLYCAAGLIASIATEKFSETGTAAGFSLPFTGAREKKVCPCVKIRALGENYLPVHEDAQNQWNGFLGYAGAGAVAKGTPPLNWDIGSRVNVRWITELETSGRSSPVVWNNQIYLSAADTAAHGFVEAYDLESGARLWRYNLADAGFTTLAPSDEQTGFAAPTPAVNDTGVFAVFSGGICVALNHDGGLLWTHDPGPVDIDFGYASSARVYKNILFLQYDHKGESGLTALNCSDGSPVYRTQRESGPSWSSPVLADTGHEVVLITLGPAKVSVSAPESGEVFWETTLLKGEITPLPVTEGGRIFAVSPANTVSALDLYKGSLLWEYPDVAPDVATPVAGGGRLFIPTSYGIMHCVNSESGELIWEYDQENGWYASPLLIGDYLVLFDRAGGSQIIAAGADSPQAIFNTIGEAVEATPAWTGELLIVRTATRLIALGEKK